MKNSIVLPGLCRVRSCRSLAGLREFPGGKAEWDERPEALRAYPMPPADAPLIPALIDLLG